MTLDRQRAAAVISAMATLMHRKIAEDREDTKMIVEEQTTEEDSADRLTEEEETHVGTDSSPTEERVRHQDSVSVAISVNAHMTGICNVINVRGVATASECVMHARLDTNLNIDKVTANTDAAQALTCAAHKRHSGVGRRPQVSRVSTTRPKIIFLRHLVI